MLSEKFDARVHPADPPPDRDGIIAGAAGCRGLLTLVRDRVDAQMLD